MDQELLNFITTIQNQESSTVTALENSVDLLISSLNSCIAKVGLNQGTIANYESNSFYTDKDVYALANISELFYQQHEDNKDVYDAICEAEQNLKDAAEERETQGVWKTVAGVVLVGVGVACIIATAGAASPIVAAVGVAMGTGMTIYGVADSAEGAQDIYYGSIGDIDLKYVVFQGNEEAYYLTESVFAFAASAMIPIGQAASAGNLTFRSGATIVAKEGIATAAGAGAQKYTTDLTGNQTAGMLAGMAASMATAKGLNGIEAGAKKLAKPKLGDVGTDGGAVLNDADVGSAVEGGSTSSYSGEEWCRYFRETYGSDKVVWENATPSQLARSWQGTGKYIGVDDYVDTVVKKGTILYRGEPNGTEYFTTLDAIEQSGGDATNVFEGLQVEKHPIHGYRGEMQGYVFNEEIASAYGITNANPQFGKGGLPQYFVPNANDYIQKGILVKVDNITLRK